MPLRILHLAAEAVDPSLFPAVFREALAQVGSLSICENAEKLPAEEMLASIRNCDVLLTGWGCAPIPAEIALDPGRLRYICHVTGGVRLAISPSIIASGLPVTNWGDAPANAVAEGAMALLLAALKDLNAHRIHLANGNWRLDMSHFGGTLMGTCVGVYGYGAIGRRFVELLRPFGPHMLIYDPFTSDTPDDCQRVDTLEALFSQSSIVAVHVGLTPETSGSITASHLAMLPRDGVIVNTARGGVIVQDALFAELESGRLRAGLDVLEPDYLEPDHPSRHWPKLILTPHVVERGWPTHGLPPTQLSPMHVVCIENLRRFAAGEPLRFVMDARRYALST